MDIRSLKAEAAELAAIAKNGEATAEQLERMNEIVSVLESRKVQADAAARAISFTEAETHRVCCNSWLIIRSLNFTRIPHPLTKG